MMGYVILAVFILFVIGCFSSFLFGLRLGKKQAEAEYAEDQRIKAQDEKNFKAAAAEIKQEALHGAAEKKAELSKGNGRDRFNNINNSLQNNPRN